MAKRKPKFNYSIICDDIREEVGNKLSLIGIYGKDIYVPRLPFTFSQLCVAIAYKNLRGGDFFSVKAEDPSGKEIGNIIKGSAPKEAKGSIDFTIFAKFAPVKISEEGSLRLEIIFNEDKSTINEIDVPIKVRK